MHGTCWTKGDAFSCTVQARSSSHTALMAEDLAPCLHPSILLGMADSHQPWLIITMGERWEAGKGNLSLGFAPEAHHQGNQSQSGGNSLFHT